MGEDAVDGQARELVNALDLVEDGGPLRRTGSAGDEPDATHAGVDFQVNVSGLAEFPGDLRDDFGIFLMEERHGQFMVDGCGQDIVEHIPEDEDETGHAVLPQFHALFDGGHRECVDPDLLEGFRHLRGTVPIGVGLDDRHGLRVRTGMVHIPLHVVANVIQMDACINSLRSHAASPSML